MNSVQKKDKKRNSPNRKKKNARASFSSNKKELIFFVDCFSQVETVMDGDGFGMQLVKWQLCI